MSDQCGWNEIRAWVAAHRDELPHTLAELARYPMAYRRAIFGAVARDVRATFWREQWEPLIGPQSELSAEQQEYVREIMAELPALMSDDHEAAQARAHELQPRMDALFTREQARTFFATLGPEEPPEGLPAPAA